MTTFKPVLWRSVIYRYFYIVLAGTIGVLCSEVQSQHMFSAFFWQFAFIGLIGGGLIVAIISSILSYVFFDKKLNIVISGGKIDGPSTGILNRKTFSIAELDKSSIYKQVFYEKILGFHTIRSINGQKISFVPFIYGRSTVNEVYKILEQEHVKSARK